MSRGLGRLERAIVAAIEKRGTIGPGLSSLPPKAVAIIKAGGLCRDAGGLMPVHFSSGQLFFECYPPDYSVFNRAPPTPSQRKAVVRAMHSVVQKFPEYALMGGQGREAMLWLYEPGDPLSKLWTELQVQYGRHAHVTLADAKSVTAGGQPSYAIEQRRRHRSYLRGARVVEKSARIREVVDLAALAKKVRKLITENDPDAIRDGLREIADALDPPAEDEAA